MSQVPGSAADEPPAVGEPSLGGRVLLPLRVAFAESLLILVSLFVYLRGWQRDFSIPFGFSIDSLFYLMQAKSTVDNGWWWFNPMVGAPFGLDELAFPANGNVDQALVWLASLVVAPPLGAINAAWILMVVVSGIAATWCMRVLSVSMPAAFAAGTLFALCPYAVYKNLAHFGMAVYLIPFVCTVALQLASGRLPERGYLTGAGLVLLAGSGLIGFNYVYYPFFGCFFILIAAVTGSLAYRQRRILQAGVLVLVVVGGCTFLNLVPSLHSWSRYGKPIILTDKVPAQAEVYALKIRTLVSPLYEHWFPPFRIWIEKETASQYPLETENITSRLGLVGSVGFLGLLGVLLAPSAASKSGAGRFRLCLGGSQLMLAGILLATLGGFGSLFNLLITPDIRGYGRICPFLEFFALTAVAVGLDAALRDGKARVVAVTVVLVVGLADQMNAAKWMNAEYPTIAAELPVLSGFVGQLEQRLPDQAMVLQLPFRRTYINDSGTMRMKPFEHLKMYLASKRLRWSFPALSNDQVGWQEAAAAVPLARLAGQLAAEGFSAIVVDRFGYQDNGVAATAAVRGDLGDEHIIAQTDRFIAIDIRSLAGLGGVSRLPTRPGPMTAGLPACSGQTNMSLDRIGPARFPSPADSVRVRRSRSLRISGWGVDQPGSGAGAGIDVVVDQTPFPTFYGLDRADVSDFFKGEDYRQSGFATELPPDALSSGAHTMALRVVAVSRQCYYEGARFNLMVD